MPNKQSSSKKGSRNARLSTRTRKQFDSLTVHAQHIFRKTHDSAIEQYQDPEKRRDGRKQSTELAANKVA